MIAVLLISGLLLLIGIVYFVMRNRNVESYDFDKNKHSYMRSQLK